MILKLIPVEVNPDDITDATSSIVSPVVVAAFAQAGGDFSEAVPFALMQARAQFLREAKQSRTYRVKGRDYSFETTDLSRHTHVSAADYDENMCRSTAAEVIARRLVCIVSIPVTRDDLANLVAAGPHLVFRKADERHVHEVPIPRGRRRRLCSCLGPRSRYRSICHPVLELV